MKRLNQWAVMMKPCLCRQVLSSVLMLDEFEHCMATRREDYSISCRLQCVDNMRCHLLQEWMRAVVADGVQKEMHVHTGAYPAAWIQEYLLQDSPRVPKPRGVYHSSRSTSHTKSVLVVSSTVLKTAPKAPVQTTVIVCDAHSVSVFPCICVHIQMKYTLTGQQLQ